MNRPLRMADLFAGTGSASDPMVEHGWAVERVDLASGRDVRSWRPTGVYDLVWASPPCERFSVIAIGRNWTVDGRPRNDAARSALDLVRVARRKIVRAHPRFFVIENPRAKLRSLKVLNDLPRVTVTYCRYGERRMKPTDLWGRFPPSFVPRPTCANGNPDHEAAPRGSRAGQQGSYGGDRYRTHPLRTRQRPTPCRGEERMSRGYIPVATRSTWRTPIALRRSLNVEFGQLFDVSDTHGGTFDAPHGPRAVRRLHDGTPRGPHPRDRVGLHDRSVGMRAERAHRVRIPTGRHYALIVRTRDHGGYSRAWVFGSVLYGLATGAAVGAYLLGPLVGH